MTDTVGNCYVNIPFPSIIHYSSQNFNCNYPLDWGIERRSKVYNGNILVHLIKSWQLTGYTVHDEQLN